MVERRADMVEAKPIASKSAAGIGKIEIVAEVNCCGGAWAATDISVSEIVKVADGGKQLAKVACDKCGTEYMLGVIVRSLEESRASEVFEELSAEEEEKVGIDR